MATSGKEFIDEKRQEIVSLLLESMGTRFGHFRDIMPECCADIPCKMFQYLH